MKLAKYKPQNELVLPAFKGSTFRGGFGHDKLLLDRVRNLFNLYRFEEVKDALKQIIVLEKEQRANYERLIQNYDLWVRFKHLEAYERLEKVKDDRISLNNGFLGRLSNEDNRIKFILVDLLNNAGCRLEEERFDDTVAVLYRANDLSEEKFTLEDLKQRELEIRDYGKYADGRGKLKIGLEKKFLLLRDLGWMEANDIYLENKEMRDLLQIRNNSIRAQGLEPVEKEVAYDLYEKTKAYAGIITNLEELMADANFAKL